MTRPYTAKLCAVLGVLAACPTVASAQEPLPTGGAPAADLGAPALFARPGELLGRTLRFRGVVPVEQSGRMVQIQRLQPDSSWLATATAQVGTDGRFVARWRADRIGRFTVRAIVEGSRVAVQAAEAPATTQVTVFRPARATWYGPGFYGRRTACGHRMSRTLVGVAHRRLPCGTPVEVLVGERTATLPVVDRGPFAHGAHYDLTRAAARLLGLTATTTIGVVPQRAGVAVTAPAPPAGPPVDAATGGTAPRP